MRRRLSPASKLFAAVAVVLGATAFVLVRGYAARVEALAPALGAPVPIVVSTAAVPRGSVLSADMLEITSYPSRFAPPGALHRVEAGVGRTLLAGLAAGEPLTRTRLSPARGGPVAALVPPGMRAFTIATSLPRGSVRPGDRVDVLATFAGGQPHTETVATDVEILTVLAATTGQPLGGLGDAGGVSEAEPAPLDLVLLVRPDEAEQLAYARAFADLSLSVDGPGEG
jgi:Flp pilus assembly protein CpaB